MFNWSSEHTFFLFLQYISTHNLNLYRKHNDLLLFLYSLFFSFVADVKVALHPDFWSSFLILDSLIGVHDSLTMLLPELSAFRCLMFIFFDKRM